MMTTNEIMEYLKTHGSEQTKKVLYNHGAREPFYGTKIEDYKKLIKKNKFDNTTALELYATGNSDAMYMAGLIADGSKMTKEQLQLWVEKAYWKYLSEYTVPWVAIESKFGLELALEWIKSDKENIVSAGWATLSGIVSVKLDEDLDFELIKELFKIIINDLSKSPDRVRFTMNQYILSVACYVMPLHEHALEVAKIIGKVNVDIGKTACKITSIIDYVEKVRKAGKLGQKRKTIKC